MKKIFLFVSASIFLVSCKKTEYTITGLAKGIENGKTIIMETQDANGMGLIAVDTVKVQDGKFEITGKATEPSFHLLQAEGINGKFLFILENGDINIEINKDSIHKSKVTGTYNNDEYVKFNDELIKIQKSLITFQTKNTPLMTQAQEAKDTVTINKLMKQFAELQESVGKTTKEKYDNYAEANPKSFISVLIIQGMLNEPTADLKKIEKLYAALDESLKSTKPGKAVETKIKEKKIPSVSTQPNPAQASPAAK